MEGGAVSVALFYRICPILGYTHSIHLSVAVRGKTIT